MLQKRNTQTHTHHKCGLNCKYGLHPPYSTHTHMPTQRHNFISRRYLQNDLLMLMVDLLQGFHFSEQDLAVNQHRSEAMAKVQAFPRLRTVSSTAGWTSVVGRSQLWAPHREESLLQERIVPPLGPAAFSPLRLYFTALNHCSIHSRVVWFFQYLSQWLIHNRWGGCVCIHL